MAPRSVKEAIAKGEEQRKREARRTQANLVALADDAARRRKASDRAHARALDVEALFALIQHAVSEGETILYLSAYSHADKWERKLFPKKRYVSMESAAAAINAVEGVSARHVHSESRWVGSMDLSLEPGDNHIEVTW